VRIVEQAEHRGSMVGAGERAPALQVAVD